MSGNIPSMKLIFLLDILYIEQYLEMKFFSRVSFYVIETSLRATTIYYIRMKNKKSIWHASNKQKKKLYVK